jgi:hypothetical protein
MSETAAGRDVRVLYVMGQDRSGSTILGSVLGSVDRFVHVGELRQLWFQGYIRGALCGCRLPTPDCPFWGRVVSSAGVPGPESADRVVALGKEVLRLRRFPANLRSTLDAGPRDLRTYAGLFGRLYRAVAELTGAEVIVDTSKHATQAAVVSILPGVDVRFVHLVRDPRATAYSWQRVKPDPGQGPEGRLWRRPTGASARAWILSNLAGDLVRRRHGDRSLLLRYEDFVADPGESLDAILSLLGVGPHRLPLLDQRTAEIRQGHSISGNPSRFLTGPVALRPDAEWVDRQSARDRLLVTALALPFLRRYGYPVRVPQRGTTRRREAA